MNKSKSWQISNPTQGRKLSHLGLFGRPAILLVERKVDVSLISVILFWLVNTIHERARVPSSIPVRLFYFALCNLAAGYSTKRNRSVAQLLACWPPIGNGFLFTSPVCARGWILFGKVVFGLRWKRIRLMRRTVKDTLCCWSLAVLAFFYSSILYIFLVDQEESGSALFRKRKEPNGGKSCRDNSLVCDYVFMTPGWENKTPDHHHHRWWGLFSPYKLDRSYSGCCCRNSSFPLAAQKRAFVSC